MNNYQATSNNSPSARNRGKPLSAHENRDKSFFPVIHKNKNRKFIRDFLPGQPQKHGFLFPLKYCLKKNVSTCFI